MSSYKALYRKYRPQTFGEVVDQEYVTKTLINAINAKKISHAYLFNGPRGIGKTSIARIFAKAINCENPNGAEPCCECEICKSIVDGSNPDIIEIDAASRTKVEQMRDTLEKVSFLPSICKYKVYIIDEVHMLSQSSFNALLKTLEEPPSHVIFVLCTTEVEKVIPTIRSRCQRFDFHLISNETMEERLKFVAKEENISIENDALSLIVDAAEGGMRDALSLLDQISSFSINETITADDVLQVSGELSIESLISIASAINVNDSSKAISYLDDLIKDGKDIEKITQGLISFFKDVLVIKNVGRGIKKIGYNRFDFKSVCDSLTNKKIFKFIEVLTDTMSEYRFSTNKRLYLEIAIIKMCDQEVGVIPKSTPVEENVNKPIREAYDPNKVYTGIRVEEKKETVTPSIKEEVKPVEVTPEPVIEKPVVEEVKVTPIVSEETQKQAQSEPVKTEPVQPEVEEAKEEPKKPVEDSVNLYEMFGDLLEIQEAPKKSSADENNKFETIELSLDNEEDIEEDAKEVEDNNVDALPIEDSEEQVYVDSVDEDEEDEEESLEEEVTKDEEESVTIIDSFDFSNGEETEEAEPYKEPVQLIMPEEEDEEEAEPAPEPVQEKEEPVEVQEAEPVKEVEDEKEYDVHIIENVLNYSDKQFKESVIIKIFNAEKDTKGTDLHKYALLLEDGNIVASSRERFILEFKEVGHCNLVMKEENYEGVKALIKKLTNESLEFISIPASLWKALSDQFIIKYKENRQKNTKEFITLNYVPCPGLKNPKRVTNDAKKIEEEEKMKQLQDIFGDTFKLE